MQTINNDKRDQRGRFIKGHIPWHKGKTNVYSQKTLQKMSFKKQGHKYHFKNGRFLDKTGYVMIYQPYHPYKTMRNYIREHRLKMEKHLGRYLQPNEIVHHIDGNKQNNKIENLILFASHSEHKKYGHTK